MLKCSYVTHRRVVSSALVSDGQDSVVDADAEVDDVVADVSVRSVE